MDRYTSRMALVFVALAVAGCASLAGPQLAVPGVRSVDMEVTPILAHLADTSPTLRAALAALDGAAPPIHIRTFETAVDAAFYSRAYGFEYGYTRAYLGRDGRVLSIVVALDVQQLRRDGRDMAVPEPVLLAEMAVVLAHELYGHAIPLALAGTVDAMCLDEVPESAPCALERENRIRSELGVPHRRSYERVGLAITAMRDTGKRSRERGLGNH